MSESHAREVPRRHDGLQIRENQGLQRLHWIFQRIAWLGFVVFVIAAGLGFTGGGGGFARAQLEAGAARLDLPAISRWQRADGLTIAFAGEGRHEILLGRAFLDLFAIERITPEAVAEASTDAGLRLTVEAGRVRLSVRPHRPGWARYEVAVDGAAAAARTLVLP